MFFGVDVADQPGGCREKDVLDGLGNTIMVCEKLGYVPEVLNSFDAGFKVWRQLFSSGNYFSQAGCGNNQGATVRMQGGPNPSTVSSANESGPLTPYSFHPGGLQVAYGDAAVQFINETIDINVWNALAKKADRSSLKYNP
jgi:hypothetical protein